MTTTYTVRYEDEATSDEAVLSEHATLEEAMAVIQGFKEDGAEYEDLYIVAPDGYTVIEFED